MVIIRSAVFAVVLAVSIALVAPLKAQATATLNVSAVVVDACTVEVRRKLARLAHHLGKPHILHRCSKGVRSRIQERLVGLAHFRPHRPIPPRIDRSRLRRILSGQKADVLLVTVTY